MLKLALPALRSAQALSRRKSSELSPCLHRAIKLPKPGLALPGRSKSIAIDHALSGSRRLGSRLLFNISYQATCSKMSSTSNLPSQDPPLVLFFDPAASGPDPIGRSLPQILSWSDVDLEYSHDYVQNLFPLPEGSRYNANIWLITSEVYDAFHARSELRESLEKAFARMIAFYGLEIKHSHADAVSGRVMEVTRGQNYDSAKHGWVIRFNHNHLRITRVLRSLRLLGLSELAAAFHRFLQSDVDVTANVSPESRMFWARAAERPLYLPPNEGDDADGIAWLKGKE